MKSIQQKSMVGPGANVGKIEKKEPGTRKTGLQDIENGKKNMRVIESNNFLTQRNKDFIDHVYDDRQVPFYITPSTASKKNKKGRFIYKRNDITLCHVLLNRKEHRRDGEYSNSSILPEAINILDNFTKKNNIEYKEVFRAALNYTYNNGHEYGGFHVDHSYDHYQLIVYLNDCDPKSVTLIKDKNKIIKIKPKKYKGVMFKNVPHNMKFPEKGERLILVITFK